DHFVDRARREEDEARYAGVEGRLEQLQGPREVDAEEDVGRAVTAGAAVARAFPLDGRVDDRVGAPNQLADGRLISQRPGHPLDGGGLLLEAAAVAARPVPAAELAPRLAELAAPPAPHHAACTPPPPPPTT